MHLVTHPIAIAVVGLKEASARGARRALTTERSAIPYLFPMAGGAAGPRWVQASER